MNGKPAVTSLQVAEVFGKDHDRVLKDIRNLLDNDDFSADNFDATSYMDTCNRQKPIFILSREGFMMIAEAFGKEHNHVLRDIEEVLSQVSENFIQSNFGQYEWEQKVGFGIRKNRGYLLTKDGFSMLAMGYNGGIVFSLNRRSCSDKFPFFSTYYA